MGCRDDRSTASEVKAAIQEAKEAGIRPLMITGDHKTTARAIAERLGIIEPGDEAGAITGQELNELSDQELKDQVAQYSVYARVALNIKSGSSRLGRHMIKSLP